MAGLGAASVTFHVEVRARRDGHPPRMKVTSAEFTYVAPDEQRRPQPVRQRA